MQHIVRRTTLILVLLCALPAQSQLVLSEGTNIAVDVSRSSGMFATDLLGSIWIIPARGGDAQRISHNVLPAKAPRWSPDGRFLVYQAAAPTNSQLWMIDVNSGESEQLSAGQYVDQQPSWHPDGDRILFSSERSDTGFDLWELDLKSRLVWRISNLPGDETDGAWSANGRHLAWVHRRGNQWSLMRRRFGQPDEVLFESAEPLHVPSWRPDGTLLTFLQQKPDGVVAQMAILSDPPLIRPLMSGEDYFIAPLSWLDRQRYFYTADGGIRSRSLDDRNPTRIRFAAAVENRDRLPQADANAQQLQISTPSGERLIIRSARLFDGRADDYRYELDIVIGDGRILSIGPRREREDGIILDMGGATVLPGFIDSYSSLRVEDPARTGAELLSYGVTAIVAADMTTLDPLLWETEATPGPRLLHVAAINDSPRAAGAVVAIVPASGHGNRAALEAWQALGVPVLAESWTTGLSLGADLLLGADTLPTSPRGRRYQDMQVVMGHGPITLMSGLADATTPGLSELLQSRQALHLGHRGLAMRRFAGMPDISERAAALVLASKPSGLPAGLALHAEFRALDAAGLAGDQVLKAAGTHAATALRLQGQVGEIAPGALADLVLVSGDPMSRVADAMNIVAVVRNGRFYSLISLLERAAVPANVE
ncbi:MAG: amidohydrolase family protein [Woeseiaceae bacterium]|nr:amidohydrolase family protein [Woeseiaceae bacterium]